MLVYALKPGARLIYILEFISKDIFNESIQLTSDRHLFLNYDGPRINYSTLKISDNELWIPNVQLLFESDIKVQPINCFELNGNKAFFQTNGGDLAFDIFAATFYLLSRYEEYLPHKKDKFGRYAHTDSLAYKESFLQLPLINIWLKDFKKVLLDRYPGLQLKYKKFIFQPSYDIDIAWSYRNKVWWRNTGGLLRSVIKWDWYTVKQRIAVLCKKKIDPFDSYQWLDVIHRLMNLKAIYFFLIATKQKGHDKNISLSKKDLQQLIKDHDLCYTIGIHPSWQSGDDDILLEQEIKQLESVVGHDIINSRQHYLRFTLPLTYQKLINLGIENDYSMGYGTVNGFRASVASSFNWYDLEKEVSTALVIHPFCFMDANAFYELKLSPDKALEQLINFYRVIKDVDGTMITLWHNNFFGTDKNFAGWRDVYEMFLKMVVDDKPHQL